MLYFLFMLAQFTVISGTISGLIGYNMQDHQWVGSVWEYLTNLGRGLCYATGGLAVIYLYVKLLGWPEPD